MKTVKTANDLVGDAKKTITELSVEEARNLSAATPDLVLLDVREPDEYQAGHLPQAVNIPRGVLEFQVAAHPALACEPGAPELARFERPICVYCRSGGRSALAAATLANMGFTNVKSLSGGFVEWQAKELPIEV